MTASGNVVLTSFLTVAIHMRSRSQNQSSSYILQLRLRATNGFWRRWLFPQLFSSLLAGSGLLNDWFLISMGDNLYPACASHFKVSLSTTHPRLSAMLLGRSVSKSMGTRDVRNLQERVNKRRVLLDNLLSKQCLDDETREGAFATSQAGSDVEAVRRQSIEVTRCRMVDVYL
jgi:hypothetical protein